MKLKSKRINTAIFICVIVVILCIVKFVVIPNIEYATAVTLMNDGKYEEAIAAFTKIESHRDSVTQIKECNYNIAESFIDDERFDEAYTIFVSLNNYKDSKEKSNSIYIKAKMEAFSKASIGSYITFGNYLQNYSVGPKDPIEWLVIAKEDDKLLVISRYALDYHCYNKEMKSGNLSWEKSELRAWLNSDFIDEAFNPLEQSLISEVKLSDYSSGDRVFLLSVDEAKKYFKSDKDRQCKPTRYAVNKRGYLGLNNYCWWWLRAGYYLSKAAYVDEDGAIDESARYIFSDDDAVRPAMWITLNP